ncbi:response regulator [Cohnella rhizosphaerae]|uniref:Response regulator n=1 Tax=Cohnella rhizosphaerae TaxID=1457232 RepID=A0A9X4KVS5_9BACL|nr:response regulator [Cohnella rhizosphaerae]MDG0811216.1 response regulator [Cohnella rhizosphaerae]
MELAGRAAPDLLITDIRLLGASGLELAARMREINPRLRIILVTGYEEFEYAKSALDIGVDAFLVKPIMFDELKALLASICQADAAERTRSREERQLKEQLSAFKPVAQEQFFQELIQGLVVGEETIRLRADAFGLFAREGLRRVLIAVIDADPDAALPKEEQIRRARGLLGEAAAAVCGALLEERTTTQRGSLVLILSERETGGFDRDTEACIERLRLEAEKIEGCTVSIGIGPPVPALNQLSRSFRLAQHAVNQRLLGGGERTYSWKTLIQPEDRPDKSIEALVGDFFEVLGAGDSQNSLNLLGEILSGIAGNLEVQGAKLRSLCLQLVTGAYRTAAEIGDAARQLGPESALWERILECGEETEQLQETVDILNGICAFIAERKKKPYAARRAEGARLYERSLQGEPDAAIGGGVGVSQSELSGRPVQNRARRFVHRSADPDSHPEGQGDAPAAAPQAVRSRRRRRVSEHRLFYRRIQTNDRLQPQGISDVSGLFPIRMIVPISALASWQRFFYMPNLKNMKARERK